MKTDFITCTNPFGTHRMAYAEWGEPSDEAAVICVHGLTRNGRDFDHLASALHKQGRHVICLDIVGRGKSDWLSDHPELYDYPQYIADVATLMAAKNITKVDWVGTSMGGLLGMLIASAPNSPINSFVINDVGPLLPVAALKRIASYVAMKIEFADMAQLERHVRQIYTPFGIVHDDDWNHILKHCYRALPNGKLVLAHDPLIARNFEALDQDVDIWQVYDAIRCPTLLLRGDLSDVLFMDVALAMTQRGPKAKLINYKGIGHAPALMDENQIGDIQSFIANVK